MSMITATYPLAGPKSERPSSLATTQARPWGFWATLGWSGGALLAYLAAIMVGSVCYGIWWMLAHPGVAMAPNQTMLELVALVVTMPAIAAMLAFAARWAGLPMHDYLGLVRPKGRHILIGLGSLIAFWVFLTGMAYLFPSLDQSAVMIEQYRAVMGNPVAMAMLWLAVVVSAPVGEELIFRGFIFRGWSETRLGGIGALVLSAMIFAMLHLQYNASGIITVFGLGLLFGLVRWISGSTVLAILLHGVWNFAVVMLMVLSL